jgi:hypothetical protein
LAAQIAPQRTLEDWRQEAGTDPIETPASPAVVTLLAVLMSFLALFLATISSKEGFTSTGRMWYQQIYRGVFLNDNNKESKDASWFSVPVQAQRSMKATASI